MKLPALRLVLLALEADDLELRERLASAGQLVEGSYHPDMEAVHRRNAARLREIIAGHGWPGPSLVGEDGVRAAWLVAQHAIGEPDFMRMCRDLVSAAGPAWQAAYLHDRIRHFEGRLQRYGTQLEIDSDGRTIASPIEDPAHVEERRRAVGLEPLATVLARAERITPPDPATRARHDRAFTAWQRRTGWRR